VISGAPGDSTVIETESVSHDSAKFESVGSILFPSSSVKEKSV
jgi:hypothetical protein